MIGEEDRKLVSLMMVAFENCEGISVNATDFEDGVILKSYKMEFDGTDIFCVFKLIDLIPVSIHIGDNEAEAYTWDPDSIEDGLWMMKAIESIFNTAFAQRTIH